MRNIYISYTNELLQGSDYVATAIEGIDRLGLNAVLFDRYQEKYTNLSPLRMMQMELMEADVFIGLYGRRYGGIPATDLEGNPNAAQKSYIELEYDYATALGIPRLIFVAQDHLNLHELRQSDPSDRARFEDFLARIMHMENVSFYASQADLLIELLGRLGRITRMGSLFGEPSRDPQFRADVFMVMPFKAEFKPIYDDHIVKVVEARGLTIRRGDDFFANHAIIKDIWSAIARCRLVIAECTGKNANVFYELGMAHTIDKPAILITQNIKDIPFDVDYLRAISYKYTPPGMKDFEKALDTAIVKLLKLPSP